MTDDPAENPLSELLKGALSEYDFVILEHGFTPYGRDYRFLIQDSLCTSPGTYELTFTHVVELKYGTRVGDQIWSKSWADVYTDYAQWCAAGEPDGYVFGTKWSLAYPGITILLDSPEARSWTERLGHPMYSISIETDLFTISLIFSGVRHLKVSNRTELIKRVLIPLSGPDKIQ